MLSDLKCKQWFLIDDTLHINNDPDVRKMSSPIRQPGISVNLLFPNLFRLKFLIMQHIDWISFKE